MVANIVFFVSHWWPKKFQLTDAWMKEKGMRIAPTARYCIPFIMRRLKITNDKKNVCLVYLFDLYAKHLQLRSVIRFQYGYYIRALKYQTQAISCFLFAIQIHWIACLLDLIGSCLYGAICILKMFSTNEFFATPRFNWHYKIQYLKTALKTISLSTFFSVYILKLFFISLLFYLKVTFGILF